MRAASQSKVCNANFIQIYTDLPHAFATSPTPVLSGERMFLSTIEPEKHLFNTNSKLRDKQHPITCTIKLAGEISIWNQQANICCAPDGRRHCFKAFIKELISRRASGKKYYLNLNQCTWQRYTMTTHLKSVRCSGRFFFTLETFSILHAPA